MQDLPLLVASGTSVHLLWWALPVVGFTCVCMKQADTHNTHACSHAHEQLQVGLQCDSNNKRPLVFNEQTPARAHSQLLITAPHILYVMSEQTLSIMGTSELMVGLMTWMDNL